MKDLTVLVIGIDTEQPIRAAVHKLPVHPATVMPVIDPVYKVPIANDDHWQFLNELLADSRPASTIVIAAGNLPLVGASAPELNDAEAKTAYIHRQLVEMFRADIVHCPEW